MSFVRKFSLTAALTLAVVAGAGQSFAEDRELHFGTLAPRKSPWGKVFQAWQDAVVEQSNGTLKLTFFWGGNQGDDGAMVDKMRAGSQLDGAAVSALGLGKIWRETLALQIPGLFRSYEAMEKAQEAMRPEIAQAFEKEGFVLGGLGTVGLSRLMSKGFPVRSPDDLKGKKPVVWTDDVIGPALFRVIGGVTPVPLTVPGVLPALGNGSVDVVSAPALAATQLQWASRLDHIVVTPGSVTMSGLVFRKASLDALSEDQRKLLKETGEIAGKALKERIRKEDEKAFRELKKKMTNVEPSEDDQAKWTDVLKRTIEALGRGTFDPERLKKLAALRG